MKRKNLFLLAGLMLVLTLPFTACQQDTEDDDPVVVMTEDEAEIDGFFDDIMAEIDEITLNDSIAYDMGEMAVFTEGAGTRTIKTYYDGQIRIDSIFYDSYVNPKSKFECVKNGTIIIRTQGHKLENTFIREISFMNFTINGNKIEGTKRIEKTAEHTYRVTLTNGKITFTDGTTCTRTTERIRTMVDGFNTPLWVWDDVYTIEGSASGVNRKGLEYSHLIINPLMVRLACRWIVQGTIEFTVDGNSVILDYGNGICDSDATVTRNGRTVQIKLRGGL